MGNLNRKYLAGSALVFSALLLFQFQNCGPQQSSDGLKLSSSSSSQLPSNPGFSPSSCQSFGCGSIDYSYWDSCTLKAVGWAWSNFSTPNKNINLTAESNSVSSTTSLKDHSEIYTAFPFMNGSNIGFKTSLPYKGDYAGNKITLSGTVTGTNGPNPLSSILTFPPMDCSLTGSSQLVGNCDNSGGFGLIENVTWDGSGTFPVLSQKTTPPTIKDSASCSLKINGWAWTKSSGSSSTVRVILADGTVKDTNPVLSNPTVRTSYYPSYLCVNDTPGFTADFGSKKIPKDNTVLVGSTRLTTVTALVYGSGVLEPIFSIYIPVPANCVQ